MTREEVESSYTAKLDTLKRLCPRVEITAAYDNVCWTITGRRNSETVVQRRQAAWSTAAKKFRDDYLRIAPHFRS